MTDIVFTIDRLERFIKAYEEASNNSEQSFVFEGHVIDIDYAKYMIQYLQSKLGS